MRKFIPLNEWRREQLELLANTVEVVVAESGKTLIQLGTSDKQSYYLISGRVLLTAADGKTKVLDSAEGYIVHPLSQLLPRKFRVTCLSNVEYLCIANHLIYETVASQAPTDMPDGYEVGEAVQMAGGGISNHLIKQLEQDLQLDRLRLPSLPEVASKLGYAIQDESSDANTIARIIQSDPAITAKIVKAANSAFYGSMSPVESCSKAVVRLGLRVTHNLVVNYTMRDLFQAKSALLNNRMHNLWKHSIRVAAICYVLAKRFKKFNPDEAMSIGLLHDIGVAAILNNAASHPELASDPVAVDQAIKQLRAPFGSRILKSWRFADQFITAATEAENWMREDDGPANYCDLLIVAQLHSFVGTSDAMSTPALNQVPAMPRLNLGELTPDLSLAILAAAQEQIEETEALLTL
ncbi:MAG: HDOD domain-containing protein [Gammaproteobacteria bacterium]|nr:HDOD domain-containing protein [Gammaproteobacteria bacterium]